MTPPYSPIVLKGLSIDPPLFLAPMVGLTHVALRMLVRQLGGVGLACTEMLSAKTLPKEHATQSPILFRGPDESPLAYQLFVTEPDEVAPAITTLQILQADVVDINLGCPAPAIRRQRGGSRLMEDSEKSRRIIGEARKNTHLPLTAKIRLGETLDEDKLKDFCLLLEGEGMDMITVHARLRGEPYGRRPRWDWVAKVKNWVSIPVVANGGIFSVADAQKCLSVSGADGLMVGRGAVTRPWLLADIAREVYGKNIPHQDMAPCEVFLKFCAQLTTHIPQERQLRRLKRFTTYFADNYRFGLRLKAAVQNSNSVTEALERACGFFERNDPEWGGSELPARNEAAMKTRCEP